MSRPPVDRSKRRMIFRDGRAWVVVADIDPCLRNSDGVLHASVLRFMRKVPFNSRTVWKGRLCVDAQGYRVLLPYIQQRLMAASDRAVQAYVAKAAHQRRLNAQH